MFWLLFSRDNGVLEQIERRPFYRSFATWMQRSVFKQRIRRFQFQVIAGFALNEAIKGFWWKVERHYTYTQTLEYALEQEKKWKDSQKTE